MYTDHKYLFSSICYCYKSGWQFKQLLLEYVDGVHSFALNKISSEKSIHLDAMDTHFAISLLHFYHVANNSTKMLQK